MFKDKDELADIETSFDRFRLELCCRPDNLHTQSGMGGNIRQLFYLLKMDVLLESDHSYVQKTIEKYKDTDSLTTELRKARDENHLTPEFIVRNNKLYLKFGTTSDKITVKDLRLLFDAFFINNKIDLPEITQEQIIDIEYMQQFKGVSINLDAFIRCIEECNKLKSCLEVNKPIKDSIKSKLSLDKRCFILNFLKNYNLTFYINSEKQYDIVLKLFDNDRDCLKQFKDDETYSKVLQLLDNNITYHKQYEDMCHSYEVMCNSLIGYREKECLTIINMMPSFISIVPCRTIIGIQNLVYYNLDDYLTNLSK
jgi:hypothetical protein